MHTTARARAAASLSFLLAFIAGIPADARAEGKRYAVLELEPGVRADISLEKIAAESITAGGKAFGPAEMGRVICAVRVEVRNDGKGTFEIRNLQGLELALVDEEGTVTYASPTEPFDLEIPGGDPLGRGAAAKRTKGIGPGESRGEEMYFIHPRGLVPAAFVSDRLRSVVLLGDGDPRLGALGSALRKDAAMQEAIRLATRSSYAGVAEFMEENGLAIDYKNRNGITVLYAGILARNYSVVTGALRDGADVRTEIYYASYLIEPIHAAVLSGDDAIVLALLEAGASLESKPRGSEAPAVFAARINNVEALRTLARFGLDVKRLMIPMDWSPAVPIEQFALASGYDEMVSFLAGL